MPLNKELANKLYLKLKEACPVDTGQLKSSIQLLLVDNYNWIILIGNDNSSIRGIPSNKYASITNFSKYIGKNYKLNRNYHWVNDAIKEWVVENSIEFNLESEDDDDE